MPGSALLERDIGFAADDAQHGTGNLSKVIVVGKDKQGICPDFDLFGNVVLGAEANAGNTGAGSGEELQ